MIIFRLTQYDKDSGKLSKINEYLAKNAHELDEFIVVRNIIEALFRKHSSLSEQQYQELFTDNKHIIIEYRVPYTWPADWNT